MEYISIVANVAISMFLVMAVGFFMRKSGLIDGVFSKSLSKLVLHLTQPVLIVMTMIKLRCTVENTKLLGKILLVSLIVHTLAAVVGWISMKWMKQCNARKLSEHSIIFANVLFFGLPVVEAMFGAEATAWASFYSMIFHIYSWTYGMVILGRERDDIKLNVKKAILNFGTVPCLIGIALYLVNVSDYLPEAVMKSLNYIGSLCTPVSLLVLGGVLATYPIKKLVGDPKVYFVCLIKLIVFPILAFLLTKYALGFDEKICMFTMVMASLPTASATNMFAELYDIEPGYAATCVGMTTALSVVTLPLMVYVATLL